MYIFCKISKAQLYYIPISNTLYNNFIQNNLYMTILHFKPTPKAKVQYSRYRSEQKTGAE